jgi:putative membrane protein
VSGWPLVLAAVVYLRAATRVRCWPRWRTASFLAGCAVLLAALETVGDRLEVHMVQHLLVTVVAAPLLVAGAPLTLALRGPWRRELAGVLRRAGPATRPAVAWPAFALVLLVTHAPPVYDLALRDPLAHALMHAAYLWTALLFWTPLLAVAPQPHRLGPVGGLAYLLAAMVPMTAIAVWLLAAGDVVYPHYASVLGESALADQRDGAAVMWLGGTLALVVAVVACGWLALAREERRARAREVYS